MGDEGEPDAVWVRDEDDTLRPVRGPSPIGDLVGGLASKRGWGSRLEGARIFAAWPDLVGEEVARRCEPVRLAGGVLVVRAESSAWATQLTYLTATIVRRADEVLRPGLVREVRIVIAGAERSPERGSRRRLHPPPP